MLARVRHLLVPHSHHAADRVDAAVRTSREGMRALWISLATLGVTAAVQAIVVGLSGSAALLGDTLHNVADALTAVPLGVAFLVGRRTAGRGYTYGYGRAEDLAGIVVVVLIAVSAALAGYQAVLRLTDPAPVRHVGAVAAAGLVGFVGNELVARYRIRVGRRIGSAALVADGLHARTDGFTSLAVVLGVGGVAIGWQWADPVVGLAITVAILFVLAGAAREIYRRLMDAVDPALVEAAESAQAATPGVRAVDRSPAARRDRPQRRPGAVRGRRARHHGRRRAPPDARRPATDPRHCPHRPRLPGRPAPARHPRRHPARSARRPGSPPLTGAMSLRGHR
jgi:cation diffusion facilitator family transporter